MDHIDAHLATASQNAKYSSAIRASLALGKAHLNKYYNMTDQSEVYRIAMSKCPSSNFLIQLQIFLKVLHPRHKLQYFRKANWDETWITTATEIIHDEFVRGYADLPIDAANVVYTKNVCIVYPTSPISIGTHNVYVFRRRRPPNVTSLMICHRSLPPLPPTSETSLSNTLRAPSRMSRTRSSGGPSTERFTRASRGWHLTTCRYQVCPFSR